MDTPKAKVVICFCATGTVKGLLAAMRRQNVSGHFILVASDAWTTDSTKLADLEEDAVGSLVLRVHSDHDAAFESYYTSLDPSKNWRDPWFPEFWETKFRCSLNGTPSDDNTYQKPCTGEECLCDNYVQDPKLDGVRKGIYLVAHALDRMVREHCPDNDTDCARKVQVTAPQFLEYLDNGTSHLLNGTFPPCNRTQHSENGTAGCNATSPVRYDIMNFQRSNETGYEFVLVGTWGDDGLRMISEPQWRDAQDGVPVSRCSTPCTKGHVMLQESTLNLCCWKCIECGDYQYVATPYRCLDCEEGMWPNANHDGCDSIPQKYLQWTETASIIVMVVCSFVMLSTGAVATIYIRYITTPLIKASSRELSFVVLMGILCATASTFAVLAKPTPIVCAIERFMPAFGVATIHAAIFTKTNRIARILAVKESKMFSRKRRFMSTTSQLVITGLLILGQAIVSGTMLAIEPPGAQDFFAAPNQVSLICNTSELANFLGLSYDFLLILLCTVWAVKTRNVPENFNEAKMIGFAMYATVVIWIAYLAVYCGSERNRELSLCLAMNVSSFMVLMFLFIPKIYIVLFHPEKNVRSKFLTFKQDIGKEAVSTVEKTTVLYGYGSREAERPTAAPR
ncbi:metabotropic glutamate receptor 1 [Ixodes scapularis]|uniref:metabotropic glutamate receptor 1 n=1 Tax=Ixodes scapularis TaxID=6945 RepID=UPI001C384CAC|nr:metabotropic glutamate receptor 1 [Ixodes scapularis]